MRQGLRWNRAQPVRRIVERRNRVGLHTLRRHRHERAFRNELGQKAPLEPGIERPEPVGRGQRLWRRIHVQVGCERHRVAEGSALLEVAEFDFRHARKLVVVGRLDPLCANEVQIRKDRGDDIDRVHEPCLRGLDRDAVCREVRMSDPRPRAQPFRPPVCLECREQTPAAFVAEEVRHEGERLRAIVRAQRRNRERDRDGAKLANGLDVELRRQSSFAVLRHGNAQALDVAALHRRESGTYQPFEHIERLATDDDELHEVGRIAAPVEIDQLVPDIGARTVRESRRGADMKSRERMSRGKSLLPCGETAAPVASAPRDVLGMHDLSLALDVFAVEPRGNEELGEPVERTFEVRGVDVEEVARVCK